MWRRQGWAQGTPAPRQGGAARRGTGGSGSWFPSPARLALAALLLLAAGLEAGLLLGRRASSAGSASLATDDSALGALGGAEASEAAQQQAGARQGGLRASKLLGGQAVTLRATGSTGQEPGSSVQAQSGPEAGELRLAAAALRLEQDARAALAAGKPVLPKRFESLDLDELVAKRALEINETWKREIPDPAERERQWHRRPGWHLAPLLHSGDPRYPFQRIHDESGKETGVLALVAPFYSRTYFRAEAARGAFWRLKAKGHLIIGISSYQHFPQQIHSPNDDRYTTPEDWAIYSACDGWLSCFRDNDAMLPPGVPRIQLSESDFMDPYAVAANWSMVPGKYGPLEKKYDLVYSNPGGEWNDYVRNWTLAKPCILKLVRELNLTILVMGRDMTGDTDLAPLLASGNLVSRPFTTWDGGFLKLVEQSRALWAPNIADASPRVLTEALSVNTPILVNWHIAGGWKYINSRTGVFFHDESDVVDAVRRLFSPDFQAGLAPRQYYTEVAGRRKAELYLQTFVEVAAGPERVAAARQLVNITGLLGFAQR